MKRFLLPLVTAATLSFTAALPVQAGSSQLTGSFTGASDHITTGGVTVVKTSGGGAVVILDSDFSLDGAPDPRVGFGKDGAYVDGTDVGLLSSNTGLQVFIVPDSVNLDDLNEVYIWCLKFGVPLGVAALNG
ncbi:MAG: DM13 domain-containing protein [Aliishimia sp.]